MTISGERTEQLDIFCHVSGFMNDFLNFTDVELIRFFHGALQLKYGADHQLLAVMLFVITIIIRAVQLTVPITITICRFGF